MAGKFTRILIRSDISAVRFRLAEIEEEKAYLLERLRQLEGKL